MKISKIAVAIAGASVAIASQAVSISGGALDGLGTNSGDGAGSGVSAVAIIMAGDVANALQTIQGMDAACIGNRSKLCAPSISSAEVRAILNNSLSSSASISSVGGTLNSAFGDSTNYTGTAATKTALIHGRASAGNVDDALKGFVQSGSINGLSCGQGASLEAANSNASGATDAAVIAKVAAGSTKGLMGFVHATSLDDTNQNYGFVKLDGVAPDLINLLSSNYNLVSNLHGVFTPAATESEQHGMTVGAVAAGSGVGVAYHNFVNAFSGCAPLDTGATVIDVNGGAL